MRSSCPASRLVVLLTCVLTCGGCFQFSTVVTVKGDGTGTIRQRVLVPPVALAQIRGLGDRGTHASASFSPLSEQEARGRANSFGTGVTYVSSEAIDTSAGLGRDVTYAFADITRIQLDERSPALGVMSVGGMDTPSPHVSFMLTRSPGGNVRLHLTVPRPEIPIGAIPSPSGAAIAPDQMAMLRRMFAGGHLFIGVEPVGALIHTSSPYVDGRLVTLIDVNIDDLLADEVALSRLQTSRTPDEVNQALQDLPGVKMVTDPEVTIEFSPASSPAR